MKLTRWEKLGRFLTPDPSSDWMVSHTGASFALPIDGGPIFDIYVTGRDSQNRSHVGIVRLDINNPHQIISRSSTSVFSPSEPGAFDENGVSYPWLVVWGGEIYMYYVGWMSTTRMGFFNNTGLAKAAVGTHQFQRVSRAPILPLTDREPFGTGSCCVLVEDGRWWMWYTVFLRWGRQPGEHRHYYVIRLAESSDGIHWERHPHICINYKNDTEYSIGKPSVIKLNGLYHMWYVYRGEQYRIGYAQSPDGLHWERRDEQADIDVSASGWDSQAICYPHVFQYQNDLYMLYCGNQYGKEGLGLARMNLK